MSPVLTPPANVSREEFETLKKRVEELHELLKAAKKYDDATNQPHCEVDDKVAILKQLAAYFDVDMKDVFDE
jgi:NTP pyrophosphatase (non-canonical NTP hydrolase)